MCFARAAAVTFFHFFPQVELCFHKGKKEKPTLITFLPTFYINP